MSKYKSEIEFLVLENEEEHNLGSKKNRIFSLTPSDTQTFDKMNTTDCFKTYQNNQTTTTNINENTNEFEIKKTNNLLDTLLLNQTTSNDLKNLKIEIDDTYFDNHMNSKYSSNSGGVGMFHPTWDEWKQRAQLSQNSKQKHESVSNKHESKDYKNMTESNQINTKTSKSLIEEYYTQSNQMTQQQTQDFYNPPSPILIRNSNTNQLEYVHQTSLSTKPKSPRHFPVAGIDFLPNRVPSPVNLSSCTLAKEPPLEIKTENESRKFPEEKQEPIPEPTLIIPEPVQQKKIKTILSTRKESAPNLTGWRTESESDSEQSKLLARASGSIPIEYISIRRDPKPDEKKNDKTKKSITTGTNTCTERGKKIAATNTNTDELPQYNLHVSLDSLFVKSRQEASTTTEIKNKNAATETSEVYHKDAGTVTDVERTPTPQPPPPPPPEPKQEVIYHRKSRYTEWESGSNPPPPPPPPPQVESSYRLEILAKSPARSSQTRREVQQVYHHSYNKIPTRKTSYNYSLNETIRADDDDRIIFGTSMNNSNSSYHHHEEFYNSNRRSGSFPCLIQRPVIVEQTINNGNTRRYIKQTHTTSYSPFIRQGEHVTYHHPQTELSLIPLRQETSNLWNQQFNEFSQKFNEIFGKIDVGKTQRYYKYSKTSTDNSQQMKNLIQAPVSFGESFSRFNSSSSSYGQNKPIIEIPVTPSSTMKSSNQFFSSRNTSTNGPIITSLSRNGSITNLNSNYFASQRSASSFEPVIQRKITTMSSTSQTGGRAREEEEEELVNMSVESERQFRPINETISKESHYRSSSTNGAVPVNIVNRSSNNFNSSSAAAAAASSSSSRRQNYSSSYEYSSSASNKQQKI